MKLNKRNCLWRLDTPNNSSGLQKCFQGASSVINKKQTKTVLYVFLWHIKQSNVSVLWKKLIIFAESLECSEITTLPLFSGCETATFMAAATKTAVLRVLTSDCGDSSPFLKSALNYIAVKALLTLIMTSPAVIIGY